MSRHITQIEAVERLREAGFHVEVKFDIIYVREKPNDFPRRLYRQHDGRYSEFALKRLLSRRKKR